MEIRKGAIISNQNWELISQGIQSLNLCEEVCDQTCFVGFLAKDLDPPCILLHGVESLCEFKHTKVA
jgi:hypothetical protein